MPILPDLKCFHKNWRPHGPESVDHGEPTNHASRSGKNKVRLEASCQRHEKADRDDPDPIGMDLVEESAFDCTMGMGHTLGADHDMICGHEVIGLTVLDERMTFLSKAQRFLLVERLRLDACNKTLKGEGGQRDMN